MANGICVPPHNSIKKLVESPDLVAGDASSVLVDNKKGAPPRRRLVVDISDVVPAILSVACHEEVAQVVLKLLALLLDVELLIKYVLLVGDAVTNCARQLSARLAVGEEVGVFCGPTH